MFFDFVVEHNKIIFWLFGTKVYYDQRIDAVNKIQEFFTLNLWARELFGELKQILLKQTFSLSLKRLSLWDN